MSQNAPLPVHSSRKEFADYYAEKSLRPELVEHFRTVRDKILDLLGKAREANRNYDVLDVGCNAGTQCILWAELDHHVHGLDINEALLQLARERAGAKGYVIDFQLGSATALPWSDQSMDVCIALELLEHVSDWRRCLSEFKRVLRPGGVMFLTTTNVLCPKQHEFNVFGYSWYPRPLKRHFERLAFTTRPELANYAKFPAVHWFTPYGLKAELGKDGFACFDRFDLVKTAKKGSLAKFVVQCVKSIRALRWLGFMCTPGTLLLAIKPTITKLT
jgi:2-polyprenyl-6-hydroxyphenyl methylase/3-demethylubiquinone-9 3-methyltransferase